MPNLPFFSLALPLNIYTPDALALILIRPCLLSPRLFDTHALTSNTAQKAAALRLRPACDHPRCLPTWYLPRESSHLPSLSQICLRSKEIHCTFESSKETVVTLFQLDVHRYIEGITGGQVVFTGGGWRRNFRLTSQYENTSESLGDPVNPPPSSFQCFSGWGHGLSVRVRTVRLVGR